MKWTILLFCLLPLNAVAEDGWREVARFSGNGPKTTAAVDLHYPWRARWVTTVSNRVMDGGVFIVTADPPEGANGEMVFIANHPRAGSDVCHGTKSGTYQFDVNAFNFDWTIVVEEKIEPKPANIRTWTSADGRKIEAEYLSQTKTHVKFRRVSDGQVFDYELAKLSEADRAWVAARTTKP